VRDTLEHIAATLRRWVGGRLFAMFCDGLLTAIGLAIVGVPYAALLGLIAGALAFIPNVGAAIAGALMVLVGFSVDSTTGFWAIGVYLTVQFVEGNLLTPFVERRVVDLAPAVVLGAQLLFGTLFGIAGVALADPIVAMIKVALERSRAAKAPQSRGTHAAWPTSNVSPVSPQPS
jgi:predicted PurR-regulated permease PerM